MNLQDDKNELPYFLDPQTNFRVLIDTGSTRSFVKKFIGFECYKTDLLKDPFEVATAHGVSKENFSSKISLLGQKKLKFFLFDFHKNFDMLLGLDNMKELELNLDFINNKITLKNKEIPILYFNTNVTSPKTVQDTPSNKISTYLIQARSQQIIKIPVKDITQGEALLGYKDLSGLEIPQCAIKVENGQALCSILNSSTCNKKLLIKEPFHVQNLADFELRPININNVNSSCDRVNNVNNVILNKTPTLDLSKIRTSHMNDEEQNAILNLVKEYADIFHKDGEKLTFTNQIKHIIRTNDEIPVYSRNYRYPEVYKTEVNRQIQEMLDQKIIQNSHSPWNSPIWMVPKKQDASGKQKYRLVIDFRGLNAKTIDDKFPLPNISDILDKLGRAQYFTTLDLASSFHQVEMEPNSVEKTAFSTETGHYEFLRMPFGLKNSPPTFQRIMNNILRGLQNEICLVYLDDIVVYSTSLDEHIQRLREVFERLRNANFKVQLDKTEFLRKEVSYLGHLVTSNGVKPNPDKIKAIKNYPIPKTTKEIKGFLGLLGYYRKFIKNFAEITKPLTRCLKRNAKIDIENVEYSRCFEICKNLLSNEPILQYPDFGKEFNLTTDASNFAIGAVLSQTKNGADLPIAYASRTLNDSETRYSTIEKELLSIVWSTKYFRPYLYGRKFKIFTDHKPLQWLFSIKEPNSKLLRWRLKLEEYNYEIVYKKGTANRNADALSRIQLNNNESNAVNLQQEPQDVDQLINESIDLHFPDLDLQSIVVNLDETEDHTNQVEVVGEDREDDQTMHSNYDGNTATGIPVVEEPVNFGKHQIILSLVKFNPRKVKIQKLFESKTRMNVEISENNFENDTIKFVKEYLVPNIKYSLYFETDFYEKFAAIITKYFKSNKLLLVKHTNRMLDVTSEDDKNEIIGNYHVGKTNHRGIQETYEQIKKKYYWPNLKNYIQNYINKCEICLQTKYERVPLNLELNLTPTASKPLEIIHVDSLTLEKKKFLTITDSFSRYAQAYHIVSAQGVEIVDNLLNYFTHHGVPRTIISDNGTEFNNSVVKELLSLHKIEIHFISTQHPPSNGIAERFHSTLIEHIRIFNNRAEFEKEPIERKVKYAIVAYNNSIHSVTKSSPFEILYGHIDPNSLLEVDIDKQMMNDYINNHKEKTKKLYDHIREVNQNQKEKIINDRNANKEKVPEIPTDVYVKTVQKQSKTKNKYKKERITSVNKEHKTATIEPRHHNTKEKIHLSKIKRPRKCKTNINFSARQTEPNTSSNPVPGPSCSSEEPPQEKQ
jgi:hypothetical protein